MIGLVIITHGALAKELVETAKLIMGESKEVIPVTLAANESLDTLREKSMKAVQQFKNTGCLVLTDVLGGSPTNICVEFLKTDWIRVLCGVNLPMVMAAINGRESLDLQTLAVKVREGAIKGIIDLKDFYEQRTKKK